MSEFSFDKVQPFFEFLYFLYGVFEDCYRALYHAEREFLVDFSAFCGFFQVILQFFQFVFDFKCLFHFITIANPMVS